MEGSGWGASGGGFSGSGVTGGGDAFHYEGAPGPDAFSRNKASDGKLSLYSGRENLTK